MDGSIRIGTILTLSRHHYGSLTSITIPCHTIQIPYHHHMGTIYHHTDIIPSMSQYGRSPMTSTLYIWLMAPNRHYIGIIQTPYGYHTDTMRHYTIPPYGHHSETIPPYGHPITIETLYHHTDTIPPYGHYTTLLTPYHLTDTIPPY